MNHPNLVAAENMKDFIGNTMRNAISLIEAALDVSEGPNTIRLKVSGKLLDEISEFEVSNRVIGHIFSTNDEYRPFGLNC